MSTIYIRGDQLVIRKLGGNAELTLENATRDTLGYLYNIGGGVTEFRAVTPGAAEWGTISGDITDQTDLMALFATKQDTLVSGVNIHTINGSSIVGPGNLVISGSISDGDKGDITVSGSGATWTVDNTAITFAKFQNISANRVMGRVAPGSGVATELTGADITPLLSIFTASTAGIVPLSGGGTSNYLRADGTWAAPSGGGGVSDGDKGDITVSSGGATWTIDLLAVTDGKIASVSWSKITGAPTIPTVDLVLADGSTNAISNNAVFDGLALKQATLVSGVNIKTINGATILGSGDMTISGTISDGDKTDITVSGSGTVFTIDNLAVTDAKIASVSYSKITGVPDAAADGVTKGVATFAASDFNAFTGVISIDYTNGQSATSTQKGFLTAANWITFNAKQPLIAGTMTEGYIAKVVSGVATWAAPTAGGGESLDATLAIGNTTARTYIFNATASDILVRRINPANNGTDYGTYSAYGLSETMGHFPGVNASGRPNEVWMFGYNQTGSGGREHTDDASYHWAIESHYETGGDLVFEDHKQMTTTAGDVYRLESWTISKTGGGASQYQTLTQWDLRKLQTGTPTFVSLSDGNFDIHSVDETNCLFTMHDQDDGQMRIQVEDNVTTINLMLDLQLAPLRSTVFSKDIKFTNGLDVYTSGDVWFTMPGTEDAGHAFIFYTPDQNLMMRLIDNSSFGRFETHTGVNFFSILNDTTGVTRMATINNGVLGFTTMPTGGGSGDMLTTATNTMTTGKILFPISAADADLKIGNSNIQGISDTVTLLMHNAYWNGSVYKSLTNTSPANSIVMAGSSVSFFTKTGNPSAADETMTLQDNLAIFNGTGIRLGAAHNYINFGNPDQTTAGVNGASGSGLRASTAGVMQFKNYGEDWEDMGSGTGTSDYINIVDYGADPTGATDSRAEIQAALDAGYTLGKRVYIPRGTFLMTNDVAGGITHNLKVKPGCHLFGDGEESVLKRSPSFPLYYAIGQDITVNNAATQSTRNYTFRNFKILGATIGRGYETPGLTDTDGGLGFFGGSRMNRVIVEGLTVESVNKEAIAVWDCNYCIMRNNRVVNCNHDAYNPETIGQLIFQGNFSDGANFGCEYKGIRDGSTPTYALIEGNEFVNNYEYGIGIEAGDFVKVSDNALHSVTDTGASVTGANIGVYIVPSGAAINVLEISGNNISNYRDGGICNSGPVTGDFVITHLIIDDNTITSVGSNAIRLNEFSTAKVLQTEIRNNTIKDWNRIDNGNSFVYCGIHLSKITNVTIDGNRFSNIVDGKRNDPLYISETSNVFFTNNNCIGPPAQYSTVLTVREGTASTGFISYGNLNLDGTGPTLEIFTTTTRDALTTPTPGRLILNSTTDVLNFYDGTAWVALGSGGGGSGTVLTGAANRLAYYNGAGTTVDDLTAITADRALISDANGLPIASAVSNTELGYLDGVTSPIQAQIDGISVSGIAKYYVTPSGLGTGSGSTPGTAVSMARLITLSASFVGGENIYFEAGGEYEGGEITIKSNTYIGRYGDGAAPIIKGTIPSTALSWTQVGAVWSATYASRVGRMMRNGAAERTARSVEYTVTSASGTNITASGATGLSSVTAMEMVAKEYEWRFSYYTISAYNSGTGSFTVDRTSNIVAGFKFRLFNHNSLIAADGDWAWVAGTIYYRSPGNVNPNTLDVDISVYDEAFIIQTGATNIVIDGINFYAQAIDSIYGRENSNVKIINCIFNGALCHGAILAGDCKTILIENNTFSKIGFTGFGGQNLVDYIIRRNTAIDIGTQTDLPFTRYQFARYDGLFACNAGLQVSWYSDKGLIEKNIVDNCAYIGIRYDATNTLIDRNKISNTCQRQNDGAGIMTNGNNADGTSLSHHCIISNNLVWNTGHITGTFELSSSSIHYTEGIYLDNFTEDTRVIGNTTYDNLAHGLFTGYTTKNNEFTGNISYNNKLGQMQILSINTGYTGVYETTGIKVSNNIFISLSTTQYGISIYDAAVTDQNPFTIGGYSKNNVFVNPYNDDVVNASGTLYTLAGAASHYSEQFGVMDTYTETFVNEATSKSLVPLELNTTTASMVTILPDGFHNAGDKAFNPLVAPYNGTVFVSGAPATGGGSGDMVKAASNTMGAAGKIIFPYDANETNLRIGELGFQAFAANSSAMFHNIYWDGADYKHIVSGAGLMTAYGSSVLWSLFSFPSASAGATGSGTLRLGLNVDGAVSFNGSYGTAGQVLTSQGNASPPIWSTGGGGSGDMLLASTNTMGSAGKIIFPYDTNETNLRIGSIGFQAFAANSSAMFHNIYWDGSVYKHIDTGAGFMNSYGSSVLWSLFSFPSASAGATGTETLRLGLNVLGAVSFNGDYGTAGYVLQSNGNASPPTWVAGGGGSSNWTVSGSDIYRNSKVLVGATSGFNTVMNVHGVTTGAYGQLDIHATSANAYISINSAAAADAGIIYKENTTIKWYTYNEGATDDFLLYSTAERLRVKQTGAVGFSASFGTSGQVLTSAGSTNPPTWGTVTGIIKMASIVSQVGIANTETVVVYRTLGANTLQTGTCIKVKGWCSQSGTNAATPTIRVRIGASTLSGNIAATLTGAVGTSNVTSHFEALVTIRTTGSSGTAIGGISQFKGGVAIANNAVTSTVTVNTTIANLAEFTFISGQAANTYNFQVCEMEVIDPTTES